MASPLKSFFDKAKDKSDAQAEAERIRIAAEKEAEDARIAKLNADTLHQQQRAAFFAPFLGVMEQLKNDKTQVFSSRADITAKGFTINIKYHRPPAAAKEFSILGSEKGSFEIRRFDKTSRTTSGSGHRDVPYQYSSTFDNAEGALDQLSDWIGVVATPQEVRALAKLAEQEPPAPPKAMKNYKM